MRIHLRIEEAALNVGISGARKRDVGASEKFVDGHVSAARLRDPHAGADTVMLYPDLNRFLDSLNERASNSMRGFRIRPRQTQREFVIANPRDDIARLGAIAYPRTDLHKRLIASEVAVHLVEFSEMIEAEQQNAHNII